MKKLLWKIRFALRINKHAKCGLWFGWYFANEVAKLYPNWINESPEWMADDDFKWNWLPEE